MIQHKGQSVAHLVLAIFELLGVLLLFLLSLSLMKDGFLLLGTDFVTDLISFTSNPFTALFIGLLATAVVQSSSTITTMTVVLVASHELSLVQAIPIILGANVGTSITSTIVSLGYIGNIEEYPRAISAASIHSIFNVISLIILFLLEATTHFLSSSAMWLAEGFQLSGEKSFIYDNGYFFDSISDVLINLLGNSPYLVLPIGLILLFISLHLLTLVLKKWVIGEIQDRLNQIVFYKPYISLFFGFITTASIQSSSVATSLIVPLVATDKVKLENAFPFIMGANVGTTLTALVAALLLGGEMGVVALSVAFTHLLFNIFGVALIFPFKRIRDIPIRLAKYLGELTLQNRIYGVAYIVVVFFILPFIFILLTAGI